jgi:hypothetical protein
MVWDAFVELLVIFQGLLKIYRLVLLTGLGFVSRLVLLLLKVLFIEIHLNMNKRNQKGNFITAGPQIPLHGMNGQHMFYAPALPIFLPQGQMMMPPQ